MGKRFMSIWFRHMVTDWIARRQPELKEQSFVIAEPERGRMVIKAVNSIAWSQGLKVGAVVADARAICPLLHVLDVEKGRSTMILEKFAAWFIRYTPTVAVDGDDGLMLDITGCTHLWGGEQRYLEDITLRLKSAGYYIAAAIADTIGTAWAGARYGQYKRIVEPGRQAEVLVALPPEALRLEPLILSRMYKLGFYSIGSFIDMPRAALRRRFGQLLLDRMAQALGEIAEPLEPFLPVEAFEERLPCLEPIRTRVGIELALNKLLEAICLRLQREGKGLRSAVFICYRIDGQVQQVDIGTSFAARSIAHLFKLFELKIGSLRPGLGIELFVLQAPVVEELCQAQETLWNMGNNGPQTAVMRMLDRIAVRVGADAVRRYLPDEHHWPERSIKLADGLHEEVDASWPENTLRPVSLLPKPERIEVTAPIPDYPPMLFIYKGRIHKTSKADGPERIEQEWWLQQGEHRDYYTIEDEEGARYWLFRLGHYGLDNPEWFLHGFFA